MIPPSHNWSVDDEARAVLAHFSVLRKRGVRLRVASGVLWLLAAAGTSCMGYLAALGWFGGEPLRVLGGISVVLLLVIVTVAALLLPLFGLRSEAAVAERLGRIAPALTSDVRSAHELARHRATAVFSAELLARHFADVRERLAALPVERVFPSRWLVLPVLGCAVSMGATAALFAASPTIVATGFHSLLTPPELPEPTQRRIAAKAPVVGDVVVELKYPEYLHRADRTLTGISGGILAPLGTNVLLTGRALVPGADRGVFSLPGGRSTAIAVDSAGVVHGRFVVDGPGACVLALGGPEVMVLGPEYQIEIEIDRPPSIRLLQPTRAVEVNEDGSIDLVVEAEDDHGLSRVDLVLVAPGGLEVRKRVTDVNEPTMSLRTELSWSPSSLRLEDAELELVLEAYDNDTIRGPKASRSAPLAVRILTPAGRHENALRGQIDVLDALIDLLASRLETPVPGPKKDAETLERFSVLSQETEDVLGRMARLIRDLGQDALTQRRVIDTFAQVREDLAGQLLFEARLHGDEVGEVKTRKSVDKVQTRLLEAAIVRVDDLIIEQQLSRIVLGGSTLERRRSELNALLDVYLKTRSESARRALLDAVVRLEESLSSLMRNVEDVHGKVDDTFLNPSAFERLDLLGSLANLRNAIADGDLQQAAALVSALEGDLGRLMASLEGGLLQFRTTRFSEGERFLGDLLDRLMAIEADELQLRRETTALLRSYQELLVKEMRGRIDPIVKKQLTRVGRMRELADALAAPAVNQARQEDIVRLRIATRELKLVLGQGDLDEAEQAAGDLAKQGAELSTALTGAPRPGLRELTELATRMEKDLAEAFPSVERLLPDRDRRVAVRQAFTQRHLWARTRKIGKWIDEQGDTARFLAHRAHGALFTVAERMDAAVTALEAKKMRPALAEQTAALEELARLREELKRGGEMASVDVRPVVLRGQVELPSPNDYNVPPEHREDILKAMRGDLPEGYQDAIRKYYETLVR